MDRDNIIKYTPIIIVVLSVIFQWNLFVTPEKLEIKHREILQDVSNNYSTKEQYDDLKTQLSAMQLKIDKMYEILTRKG